MDILPAIDLRQGKCVRLLQGDYARQIEYRDDPAAQALEFEQAGARWIHVVDLDGARHGGRYNFKVLERIKEQTNLHIEIGGGIRTEEAVSSLLKIGIARVIIGTRALEEPDWFRQLVHKYPQQIALGLDARHGKIATHGWTVTSKVTVKQMAQQVGDLPLAAIIYTDIVRDGMLSGPNIAATRELAQNCPVGIIASGGISRLKDIEQLAQLPLKGIIVGRALYENCFTLTQALEVLESQK